MAFFFVNKNNCILKEGFFWTGSVNATSGSYSIYEYYGNRFNPYEGWKSSSGDSDDTDKNTDPTYGSPALNPF